MIIQNSVIFRNILWKDYPALERFMDAFTSGSRGDSAARRHLNRLSLYDSLRRATYARGAFLGSRLIGLILGRCSTTPLHPEASWFRFYNILALNKSPQGRYFYKTYRFFQQTDQRLLSACHEDFQGELLFIAVHPRFRRQGIGLTLLYCFHTYMLGRGVRQIFLFTDSGCCCGFYDRQRFDRLCAFYWPDTKHRSYFGFYLYKFTYTSGSAVIYS
ncbi:MAG TPA: GNAT family N-acetyltransferase [Candidatus Scybalocola faecigallinarum]|uniref:GNAT family N-acetyltransferase n=1 Tax=Candidatus Scybalocola faecigallinarum TaxID=2840941 RepID=A0A9D1F634_9FIRM|nr:GNAT family N-acetyltransferase [Candidatus Scybalocola faecigallinarum]